MKVRLHVVESWPDWNVLARAIERSGRLAVGYTLHVHGDRATVMDEEGKVVVEQLPGDLMTPEQLGTLDGKLALLNYLEGCCGPRGAARSES